MKIVNKFVAFLLIPAFISGCFSPENHIEKKKTEKVKKANLPPPPKLAHEEFPVMYTDGTYTVSGFFSKISGIRGKEVTVKGYVYEKYICPAQEKICKPPFLLIVDDLYYPKKKLLITGPEKRLSQEFEEKKGYSFTGEAAYFTPDSKFIRVEGLLILSERAPEIK
jgi:hypothetical protein